MVRMGIRSSDDVLDAVQSFLIDSTPAGTAVGSPQVPPLALERCGKG